MDLMVTDRVAMTLRHTFSKTSHDQSMNPFYTDFYTDSKKKRRLLEFFMDESSQVSRCA